MLRYLGPIGVLAIAGFVAWYDATQPLSTIVLPGIGYLPGLRSVLAQEVSTVVLLFAGGLGWLAGEAFFHWRRRVSATAPSTPAGSPPAAETRDRDG